MKYIFILLTSLTMYGCGVAQIPDGTFHITYGGTDSTIRKTTYNSDSFEVVYHYSKLGWMDTGIGRLKKDCDTCAWYEDEEGYIANRHYFALVSVFKITKDLPQLIYRDIEGYYVPAGCYEDTPEAYIREAFKRKKK